MGVKINVLISQGGLGDFIAAVPAMRWLIKNQPDHHYHFYIPDVCYLFIKELMAEHLREQDSIRRWSKLDSKKETNQPGVHMSWLTPHTSMRTHLVDYAYHVLCDYSPSGEDRNYPRLPHQHDEAMVQETLLKFHVSNASYVVVTTGYTAPVRQWLPKHVNGVTAWLKEQGIVPVFMGKRDVAPGMHGSFANDIDFSGSVNLIDQTNLLEAGLIMSRAKCVVGLDNGLLHLAATTDVPIIMGFTSVKPEHRLPQRHGFQGWNIDVIEPEQSLKCRFCQSKRVLVEHDFKLCIEKTYECLNHLTAERFIEKIRPWIIKNT